MSTLLLTLENGETFAVKGFKGAGGKGILAVADDAANLTLSAMRKLTGITSTWPSDDSFAFLFNEGENVRAFRFRAIKTAGNTPGATLRYCLDAPTESAAEQLFLFTPISENLENLPYFDIYEEGWTEWVDIAKDEEFTLALARIDFLATADTWTIIMEVA